MEEFQKLVNECNPGVICLSETWLKPNNKFKLKGYDILRKDRLQGNCGGVAILLKRELKYKVLNLNQFNNGNMECLAVKLNFRDFKVSIFNCYSPPGQLTLNELDHYVDQLNDNDKIILCGDFNARHNDWDGGASNAAGNIMHSMILNSNRLSLFTPKDIGTRMNVYHNTESTLDLCIGSSELLPNISTVKQPVTGTSDHFPIIYDLNINPVWNTIKFRGKWKLDDKAWPSWLLLLQSLQLIVQENVNQSIDDFSNKLKTAAGQIFKHSSGTCSSKYSTPWWNEECSLVRARKRRAKRTLKRHFSPENLQNYKRAVAICKRTHKRYKKKYWQDYCTQLSKDTPLNKVWNVFNSIKGKQPPDVYPLESDSNLSSADKANKFANFFKNQFEAPPKRPDEDALVNEVTEAILYQHHAYNISFKIHEMELIINELPKGKASGTDDIPYEFISHLDEKSKTYLLEIFNACWNSCTFPDIWKHGLIMPLLKPGKKPTSEESYRPLVLLSCLSKLFEKMILNRLTWFLEKHSLLPDYQSGFRKNRSTLDQLIRLEHTICKNIKEKKVVITVLFDISKAYDRVPHILLLAKLSRMGIKGKLLGVIKSFLEDRSFQVTLLGEVSDSKKVNCGVPQGSILSPSLFLTFLSDLPELQDVNIAAFADDLCFYTSSTEYDRALSKMQRALDAFRIWCDDWMIKINTEKRHVQYFTRKKITVQPILNFGNIILNYENVYRYLGLYFDSPYLTWYDHIQYLTENCNKRLNILRAASSTSWGADRYTLLSIYKAFILSKLTYGCEAFGSASKTILSKLEIIQNSALRIVTGALRSTPILSLRSEVNLPPIRDLVEKLNVKYFMKTKYLSNNHVVKTEVTRDLNYVENLHWNHYAYKVPGVLRAYRSRLKLDFPNVREIENDNISPIPPWINFKVEIKSNYGIQDIKKMPICFSKNLVDSNLSEYQNFTKIYTDGSRAKINGEWRSGAAVIVEGKDISLGYRLNGVNSIMFVELFGILMALKCIKDF